jgi:hypothetical protein
MNRRLQGLGILIPALLAPLGCSLASMPLPDDLSPGDRMVVEGRQGWRIREAVRFGPFTAGEGNRSWTRGRDRQSGPYATTARAQTFDFVLSESGRRLWAVSCEAALLRRAVDAGVVEIVRRDGSGVRCTGRTLDGPGPVWRLDLQERGDRPLEGVLSGGGRRLEVTGTRRADGALPATATTGYTFRENDRSVAAVEVINAGAVWMRAGIPDGDRGMLAAAAAAMLLLEDLRGTLEDGR